MTRAFVLAIAAIGGFAITGSHRFARAEPPPPIAPSVATATIASPTLAAIAAAPDDARRSVLLGPSGQVYAPDGRGAWARRTEGGIATTITTAALVGGAVIAGGAGSPPYRFVDGAWTALHLGKGASLVGRGTRALAAAGREVFALERGDAKRLAEAPAAVTALAGGSGVVIATAQGAYRLDGASFRRLDGVPTGAVLVSDQWAIVGRGVRALRSSAELAWPSGVSIDAVAPAPDGALAAAGLGASGLELLVVHAGRDGRGATLDRTPVPLPDPAHAVGVAIDRDGRAVIATADGRVAVRDRGEWSITTVRDDLPAPRPGPPPAPSRGVPTDAPASTP